MAKLLKWAAFGLAAIVLLLAGVALALQHWLRTDDFRVRVEKEAASALGVPLKLGRLSVDIWPLPAVAVDDVVVQTRPALTVARVEARPDWRALLAGRLEISTLIVRKAVLPQSGISALTAAMQRREKAAAAKPAHASTSASGTPMILPRRAVFEEVSWIDEKGQRMTVNLEAEFGADRLLDKADAKVVYGRLAGTHATIHREPTHWPLRVDIGGGRIMGKLQLQAGKGSAQVLSGQLAIDNVEVSAITAPSKPLTGKLQAQTTLRSEFREPGQLVDMLVTQTRFTVRDAVVTGIDLQKAVQTVGLSRGGITHLDTLAGQVATQGKAVQLTNLVAASGALGAQGNVAMTANQALSGRIVVDLATTKGALGVPLVVGGTVDDPSVMPSKGAMLGAAVGTLLVPGAGTAAGATAGDMLGEGLRGLFSK